MWGIDRAYKKLQALEQEETFANDKVKEILESYHQRSYFGRQEALKELQAVYDEDKKVVTKFRTSAVSYGDALREGDLNREDVIRELKALYPEIDGGDIEAMVYYELYPDLSV